ncbi:MAG: hypothetical protein KDD82_23920 [Planctomycetes bacterium]|nr:hypothetical protein [Planctomycetota bacterium]
MRPQPHPAWRRFPALLLSALLVACTAPAQDPAPPLAGPPSKRRGINLSKACHYSREVPFADVFQLSSPWIHQNADSTKPWRLDEALEETADGWPVLRPGRGAATLLLRGQGGKYPAGDYVCTYRGSGRITASLDGRVGDAEDGRLVIEVANPSDEGILLKIVEQDPQDPIRDLHVWLPGYEDGKRVWNQAFLDALRPFGTLRFMDWQRTNNSVQVRWAERSLPSHRTQDSDRGVCFEHVLALCNELDADLWLCVPHQADDGYLDALASFVAEQLEPELRVYLEYSNEVWNGMFEQRAWVEANTPGGSFAEQYAARCKRAFAAFAKRLPAERLVRVVATQGANVHYTKQLVAQFAAGEADALSPAYYLGLGGAVKQIDPDATPAEVVGALRAAWQGERKGAMEQVAALAAGKQLPLVAYEGGQHLVNYDKQAPNRVALIRAQNTPDMERLYADLFAHWKQLGGGLFCAYSLATAQDARSGSWGHLDSVFDPPQESAKYRALLEWWAEAGEERGSK